MEEALNWLKNVENFDEYMETPKTKIVKFLVCELRGGNFYVVESATLRWGRKQPICFWLKQLGFVGVKIPPYILLPSTPSLPLAWNLKCPHAFYFLHSVFASCLFAISSCKLTQSYHTNSCGCWHANTFYHGSLHMRPTICSSSRESITAMNNCYEHYPNFF